MKDYILYYIIIPDVLTLAYFYCSYFGFWKIYADFVPGGRLSGHWLKFALHNAGLIRHVDFQLKLKQNQISKSYIVLIPVVCLLLASTYWTLFWTALMYHTQFECIVGFIVGTSGGFLCMRGDIEKIFNNKKIDCNKNAVTSVIDIESGLCGQ